MDLTHHVESYRFWDIVQLWGRDTLQHEYIVAKVLARGVVRDGLRVQSVDPKWAGQGSFDLIGAPFVGYVARDGLLPIFIRSQALRHLMAIVETSATPDQKLLHEEFVTKQDFRTWLEHTGITAPAFWFSASELAAMAPR